MNAHIAQLLATDADVGNNARLTYSLSRLNEQDPSSSSSSPLPIDIFPNTGIVHVRDALDRETVDHFELLISVHDHGMPVQLNSTALLRVDIEDINDNRPYWAQSAYNFEVAEDASIGTLIGQVSAFDVDLKENSTFTYNHTADVDPIIRETFRINPSSGQIYLRSSLDRELKEVYEFSVEVCDHGPVPLSSEDPARVTIKLLDINDNRPVFDTFKFDDEQEEQSPETSTTIKVPLGTPKKSSIATFKARDPDCGENGTVYYSLLTDSELFDVDRHSGTITTRVEILDVHQQAVQNGTYHLSLIASDGPGKKSKVKLVNFKIVDRRALHLNLDSVEVVEMKMLQQDARFGHPVGTIDLPLSSVNRNQCGGRFFTRFDHAKDVPFFVDSTPTGEDPVNRLTLYSMDFSKTSSFKYNLLLCIDWQQCAITLADASSSGHSNSYHSLQCDHYVKINVHVDRSHPPAGCLPFKLAGGQSNNELYEIKVPWSASNDGKYRQRYNELMVLNQTLTNCWNWQSEESKLHFELTSPFLNGDELGQLFQVNGQMLQFHSNNKQLISQYLHQDFMINLIAKQGSSELQTVPLRVKILSSDHSGIGQLTFVNAKMLELDEDCCRIGSPILQARINVSHDDFKIRYFLFNHDQQQVQQQHLMTSDEQFVINSETGMLTLKREFDFERKHEHRLNITAVVYDGQQPIMSMAHSMRIKIINVNDEKPRFSQDQYVEDISEDVPIGTTLLHLIATDADQPQLPNITYLMATSYEYAHQFQLNSRSGELKVVKALDREVVADYWIPVYAFDESFEHYAFTLVHIRVSFKIFQLQN